MNAREMVQHAVDTIQPRLKEMPVVGIVLGSGLGKLAEQVEEPQAINYAEIPGFPVSTAPGHVGRFVFGHLEGVPVVMMQGRLHLYEGLTSAEAVLPIRVMAGLGIRTLILTNAAGAIADAIQIGDFCLIQDHISTFVPSPLKGMNEMSWGPRFPDMTHVYHPTLREMMREAGEEAGCTLHDGVYMQFPGPAYETPAEIRMAKALGADMAGMSTVIEAIAAHHMGVSVVGVSLATNLAAGRGKLLTEQEVIDEGERAALRFQSMIRGFLKRFAVAEWS